MRTHYNFMLKKIENTSLLCLLKWRCNTHSFARTTLSQSIFHGPKDVRAIEVLLYIFWQGVL